MVLALFICRPSDGLAQGNFWRGGAPSAAGLLQDDAGITYGKWRFRPVVGVAAVYNSNIFLSNDEKASAVDPETGLPPRPVASDTFLKVFPGIAVDYDMGVRGGITFGYAGDFAFHREWTGQDWQRHSGLFDLDYQAPGGPLLKINNRYTASDDPYGNEAQYGLGETRKRQTNTLRTEIGWKFPKDFKALAYFNHIRQKYEVERVQDAGQNWTGREAGLGAEKKVLSRTWAFLQYHYGRQTYDDTDDLTPPDTDASNRRNRVNLGVRWDGVGKLTGSVNFGYEWLNYDNDQGPAGASYVDQHTWTAATDVGWRVSEATQLNLSLSRSSLPASGFSVNTLGRTTIGVRLAQDLPYKFSSSFGAAYGLSDYELGRRDHNYNAYATVVYQFRPWLDLGAGYRYLRNDSSEGLNSFTVNEFTITLGVRY